MAGCRRLLKLGLTLQDHDGRCVAYTLISSFFLASALLLGKLETLHSLAFLVLADVDASLSLDI